MSEENKALIRRYFEEVWNKGNLAFVDENMASSYVNHDPALAGFPQIQGFKQRVTMIRTAFPDFHFTIDDMVAEGDKVVTRWTARGTNRGAFMGIPPTGRPCR